jgi:hypothetical protein
MLYHSKVQVVLPSAKAQLPNVFLDPLEILRQISWSRLGAFSSYQKILEGRRTGERHTFLRSKIDENSFSCARHRVSVFSMESSSSRPSRFQKKKKIHRISRCRDLLVKSPAS